MAIYDPLTSWPDPSYYAKFTDQYLQGLRVKWDNNHHRDGNTRGYTEGHLKLLGLKGEVEFAKAYGLLVDEEYYRDGDGGVDFIVPFGSIDVKTSPAKPWSSLLHKEDKPVADIVVLQLYQAEYDYYAIIGWATRGEILAAPKKYIHMNGAINRNRNVDISDLRSSESLDQMFTQARLDAAL